MKKKILYITITYLVYDFFNSISSLLILLFISNIIDMITGLSVSYYLKKKITIKKILLGIIKKISLYFLIVCGYILDVIIIYTVEKFNISLQINFICGLISIWLILNEQISIICNLMILRVPVPNFFLKIIKELQSKINNKIKK